MRQIQDKKFKEKWKEPTICCVQSSWSVFEVFVPYVTAGFYLILFNNTNSIGKFLGFSILSKYSSSGILTELLKSQDMGVEIRCLRRFSLLY